MTLHRKNIDVDTTTTNGINHTVLIRDATTPFALKITLQRLWLTKSRKGVQLNVFQQFCNALHDFHISRLLPIVIVLTGFRKQYYFHRSSIAMG